MKRAVCKRDGPGLPFCHSRERWNPEGPHKKTAMANHVQTFTGWIPAFAGMTGYRLRGSDKNFGDGCRIAKIQQDWASPARPGSDPARRRVQTGAAKGSVGAGLKPAPTEGMLLTITSWNSWRGNQERDLV
jgi:hypothetical protein